MIEWWQLAAVGVVVLVATSAAVMITDWWQARRESGSQETCPCLEHLGTEADGFEWWCWLREGHGGPHLNQWGVEVGDGFEYVEPATISDTAAEDAADPMHLRCLRSSDCQLEDGHQGVCYLVYGDQCQVREYPDGHRCLRPSPHTGDHHYGHWPEVPTTEVNAVVVEACSYEYEHPRDGHVRCALEAGHEDSGHPLHDHEPWTNQASE